ncbi:MAG: hypothetical protein COX48_01900, partial [bacterium (Candidatus Stahlbacteria) CG23_combo_of_CG06-09_8_20_14_all_34_7]
REGSKIEIKNFLMERNLKLSENKCTELLERTHGTLNNALNILNMWYISGDDSIIDEILNDEFNMDFSQILQYKISESFFKRNKGLTIEIIDRVLKWNIMNIDGIVLMLMREIEKVRNPFMFETGFVNNEAKKWKIENLDYAFENLYILLRDLRTNSSAYAELLIQEKIISILEWG